MCFAQVRINQSNIPQLIKNFQATLLDQIESDTVNAVVNISTMHPLEKHFKYSLKCSFSQEDDPRAKLYVGNLHWETTEGEEE